MGATRALHRRWSGDSQQPTCRGRGRKVARGARAPLKDVKNEGRSGNVYENKGPCDNLPDTKDDISARLHAILHKNTRILQKPSALLSQFERWRTNRSLQNVETRGDGFYRHMRHKVAAP